MSARIYTIVTFDVDGITEARKGSDYQKAKKKLEVDLNELTKEGWKIVGQSLLTGKPQRILYTLEKKQKHQLL